MARKKSLSVYILALLLFVGGVGYMAWAGLSENSVYFLNVSEALTMPSQELQAARLFGTVAEGDIADPTTDWGCASACGTPISPALWFGWNTRA